MDQYEKLGSIGEGSFGKVYKIRRKADGKVLVWKELNYSKMNDQEKQQIVSEVNILHNLRNPFIVRYYDRILDKQNSRLFIVMEYCSGGDLGAVIEKCRRDRVNLEEGLLWKILAQLVIALKDCHRHMENNENKPILHRDLKPANILLDANKNLKIGDFGLAKTLASQSKLAKTQAGSPAYMSPELIKGHPYDERSDIWSIGCLLYELAALRLPFQASNALSLAMKINAGRFSRIPNKYSEELYDVIKSMLQVDSKRRPRVEELELLPPLQPYLREAMAVVNEFKQIQNQSSKSRELKQREEAIAAKEAELKTLETNLLSKEKHLAEWQQQLQIQQQQLQAREAALANHDTTHDKRMSIDAPLPTPPTVPTSAGFDIYVDAAIPPRKADSVEWARELLGRPRLAKHAGAPVLNKENKENVYNNKYMRPPPPAPEIGSATKRKRIEKVPYVQVDLTNLRRFGV